MTINGSEPAQVSDLRLALGGGALPMTASGGGL